MNFKDTIAALAKSNEDGKTFLTLAEAVAIANILSVEDEPLVYTRDLRTIEQRAQFANTLPEVREAFWENRKITAIKALRDASRTPGTLLPETSTQGVLGLKDAKDAIDALWVTGLTNRHV
jgi:hypothetical protein